jgi:DNA polymerase III subunit delta
MKLGGRDALAFFRKPDPAAAGVLISGEDVMRVALRRQQVIAALIGPEGDVEMRLTRIPASDLRKDPALLLDAVRAVGFFPGARVAFVEDASDGLTETMAGALADWRSGDAQIVVTAGQLTAKSSLKKLFEGHRTAVSISLYDDPPGPEEIAALLAEAGLSRVGGDARLALDDLARRLDPGDFRQTVEKLGLYKRGDGTEVSVADLMACAPQSSEAEVDELLSIVASGRSGEIAAVLRSLYSQGVGPVGICIPALRHFRTLHVVATDPGGPSSGIGKVRPPLFGPARDQTIRQASQWGAERLERALVALIETDLQLRSASTAPQQALVERALIKLAMMVRR